MEKKEVIGKIKSEITEGWATYLEGEYDKNGRYYLWWYMWLDDGIIWIEFEDDRTPGRNIQNAEDFDADVLESVLDSVTEIKEKLIKDE